MKLSPEEFAALSKRKPTAEGQCTSIHPPPPAALGQTSGPWQVASLSFGHRLLREIVGSLALPQALGSRWYLTEARQAERCSQGRNVLVTGWGGNPIKYNHEQNKCQGVRSA